MKSDNKRQFVSPFPEMEMEANAFWKKSKTFEKSVERDAPKGDYVFFDGPPFATGLPHYGHIVGSIIKDVVPRYQTMKGYKVERKWGWDCHGLPIENIVEKELGSKNKKDIEALGVDKFNEICRTKVDSYVDDWKKVITKLGRWADMKNAYMTMDLPYMESVWGVFKNLWDKELIYKSHRSMHVCPRCETTLSQSEVSEGYQDIKDLSAVAKFELIDEPGTFVLAWTTTPWTLIGNVALAVGADIDYVKISATDVETGKVIYYILAKDVYENKESFVHKNLGYQKLKDSDIPLANPEVAGEFKGADLVGKAYKPLVDYYSGDENLENRENGWKIYVADFVTTDDGVGIVHIAPAFGEDDMALGKENNLPFVQHLSMDGNFKPEVKAFEGLNVKPKDNHMATDIEVIKYLAHNGLLFSKEKYEHSYPHCWRCDSPLLNYATSSWFVNITKIKPQMLENAKDINWSPGHIKAGRWGKWLEGARDWSISRQRFWASVMPIWECECGERKVFGSVAELEKESGEKITDIHKHIVDKITVPCVCGKQMNRIPDVLDTWFDSGSMPYAQMHYPMENKEKFENNFPAEFIGEGADQTRCWFYYMHALSTATQGKRAFNNVIVNGIVLAEDGKKMSKKLQNYPDPNKLMDKYGADALRYYLLTSPVMLADTLCFSEKGVMEAGRKVNTILLNVYKMYEMFAGERAVSDDAPKSDNVLDQWILARLNQLIIEVTAGMDAYNLPQASRPIVEFVDDLSTWYIRRSRDRFKSDDKADAEKALKTTGYVLKQLAIVMAPFMPFISEQIWQKVTGNNFSDENKSVHLEKWVSASEVNEDILNKMEMTRKVVELGFAKRDEVGMKVRQPLRELQIVNCELRSEYETLIMDEMNVKSVKFEAGKGDVEVELDTELTEELKQEGNKREVVRFVNALRKNAGLTIGDMMSLCYETEDDFLRLSIEKFVGDIKSDTLAGEIRFGKCEEALIEKDVKVNGSEIWFGIFKKQGGDVPPARLYR